MTPRILESTAPAGQVQVSRPSLEIVSAFTGFDKGLDKGFRVLGLIKGIGFRAWGLLKGFDRRFVRFLVNVLQGLHKISSLKLYEGRCLCF